MMCSTPVFIRPGRYTDATHQILRLAGKPLAFFIPIRLVPPQLSGVCRTRVGFLMAH